MSSDGLIMKPAASFLKGLRNKSVRLFYELVACRLPGSYAPVVGRTCRFVRLACVRRLAIECGQHVNVEHGARVAFGQGLRIGDYSGLGVNCFVDGPVTIGRNVLMGPQVAIWRRNHAFGRSDVPIRAQGATKPQPLCICDDTWIGFRAIILPSVTRIGRGAIIGAGAVVSRNVPDYAIVAGNPGRIVKMRPLTHDPTGEIKITLPSGATC